MNAMPAEDIRLFAPAAFAERPAEFLSDRYGFLRTIDLVDEFANHGWLPASAKQDKPRRRNPEHVRHVICLRHKDAQASDDYTPQILVMNSHNGRTKLRMMAGMYRFVCANGLIVGDTKFHFEMPHNTTLSAAVGQYTEQLVDNLGALHKTIEIWKGIQLTAQDARRFAEEAIKLRFCDKAGAYVPEDVLKARRAEDDGRTLWQVYNTVQENTTKGGLTGANILGRRVQSRALTGIGQDVSYNDKLWQLAASFA